MYRPLQQAHFQPLRRSECHAPRVSDTVCAAASTSRIFRLMFTDTVLDRVAVATNAYVEKRAAGHTGLPCKSVSRADIIQFIASLIYRPVVSLGTKSHYFGGAIHEMGFSKHPLLSEFTLVKLEQIN